MAALFAATITYAPASTAAISSARIVGVWVRLFIAESPRFYRSESNAGLPFWPTDQSAGERDLPIQAGGVGDPERQAGVALTTVEPGGLSYE